MTITQKSILDEVAKSTAYLGAKRGQYELISTVDANDEILGRYWRQAVASAAVSLGSAAEVTLTETPSPAATFALASAIDPALAESLIRAYLIESVVAKWLALTGLDADAEAKAPSTITSLASLTTLSNCSTRPLSPF